MDRVHARRWLALGSFLGLGVLSCWWIWRDASTEPEPVTVAAGVGSEQGSSSEPGELTTVDDPGSSGRQTIEPASNAATTDEPAAVGETIEMVVLTRVSHGRDAEIAPRIAFEVRLHGTSTEAGVVIASGRTDDVGSRSVRLAWERLVVARESPNAALLVQVSESG